MLPSASTAMPGGSKLEVLLLLLLLASTLSECGDKLLPAAATAAAACRCAPLLLLLERRMCGRAEWWILWGSSFQVPLRLCSIFCSAGDSQQDHMRHKLRMDTTLEGAAASWHVPDNPDILGKHVPITAAC